MLRDSILGVVLAGGQSRRMGTDKALLQVNGTSLLQRCCDLLHQVNIHQFVICRNGPEFLNDRHPDCGPMGGIHSALLYAQHPVATQVKTKAHAIKALLILPVDMPLLNEAMLNKLLSGEACEWEEAGARCFYQTPLPLLLLNKPEFVALSEQVALSPRDKSIRHFLQQTGFQQMKGAEPENLINTNDQQQWQQAVTRLTDRSHQ